MRGHAVYSFLDNGANVASGDSVIDELKQFGQTMADWEDNPVIEHIFESEIQALRESDAVILLEPAGRSSLAEAGIAYGMGKKVILIGLVEHPEVVYRICTSRYRDAAEFLASL